MIDKHVQYGVPEMTADTVSQSLPEFERPPVVEVAISVQFDELAKLQPAFYGLLWERFRQQYPKSEHHPPLGSVRELFDAKGVSRASLNVLPGMPAGRCWFLSEDQLQLIQVQPDRFVVNWRKLDTEAAYPRYRSLRDRFVRELEQFLDFIRQEDLGEFQPLQCEVTYVNHLFMGEGWESRTDLPNVLTVWSGETSESYLPPIEEANLNWQYRMDEGGGPMGRLYVQVQPAIRTRDRLPLFRLNLIGRGAPTVDGVPGVLAFTDRAHEWIVRGFTAITTDRMHRMWRRTR